MSTIILAEIDHPTYGSQALARNTISRKLIIEREGESQLKVSTAEAAATVAAWHGNMPQYTTIRWGLNAAFDKALKEAMADQQAAYIANLAEPEPEDEVGQIDNERPYLAWPAERSAHGMGLAEDLVPEHVESDPVRAITRKAPKLYKPKAKRKDSRKIEKRAKKAAKRSRKLNRR